MPIYEYRCTGCGTEFEVIQRISDRPLTRCEDCGGRLEKLLSRTAFLLKGSGWYADGYGTPAPKKERAPEKADAASATEKKRPSDASASSAKSPASGTKPAG